MDTIFETIKEYLSLPKTNYAIQLNGPWGTGKTYYVNKILKPKIEDLFIPNSTENYKFIYISLNGIKNVDEIDESLFLNSINQYGNKAYKYTKIGLRVMGKLPGLGLAKEIESEVPNITKQLTKLKNAVLCFDDLERIDRTISIQQVLGYINTNFVEHENIKTLFVSNENQLHDNGNFKLIREKVIGRTIKYDKTINGVLPDFIRNTYGEDSEVTRFYEENSSLIVQIIAFMSKDFNLRTLRFAFDSFKQIISECSSSINRNNSILLSLFINVLLISDEYKKGLLHDVEQLEPLYNSYIGFLIGMRNKDGKREITYAEMFYHKYLEDNPLVGKNIILYRSILTYILTGHLDVEGLKKEIDEKHDESVKPEEELALKVINDYNNFELKQLRESVDIVIKGIKKGYYPPEYYPELYRLLSDFNNKKYIEKDKYELYESFNTGLEEGFNKHEIQLEEYSLRHFDEVYEDVNYNKLVCKIKNKKVELIKLQKKTLFIEFVQALKEMDEEKLPSCISRLESEKNFFEIIDKEKFSQEIVSMPNGGINKFMSFLRFRYLQITNANEFYNHEVDNIEIFILAIENRLEKVSIDPLKKDLVLELIKTLQKTKKHVSKSDSDVN